MEFSVSAGALRDALATARYATPSNPSLVAHSGVLLSVKGGQLDAIGTDGETTIGATIKVTSGVDGQALLLPRPLGSYLGTLEAGTELRITLSASGEVEVKPSSASAYRFRPIAATLAIPPAPKATPRPVDLRRLGPALAAVRASVAKDNPGVQLISNAKGLTLHTTDNYRLSRAFIPEAGFGDFAGVVPLNVLDRLSRMETNSVSVDAKGRTLRFTGPGVVVTTRLLSSAFPEVSDLLDLVPPADALVPAQGLRQRLNRLSSVAESSPLKVRFEGATLTLSVSNADLGSGSETLELPNSVNAPFEFLVKLSYLSDSIASHDAKEIKFAWSAPLQPIFLRSVEPLAVTTVFAPVRA